MSSDNGSPASTVKDQQTLAIDERHHVLQAEHEGTLKKTFTNWVNSQLSKHPRPSVVVDLFVDIQDGHKLLDLLEVLSGENLPREKGRNVFQSRSNVDTALTFLGKRSIKLINIHVEDIISGKPSIVLGLIWKIILHFQIEGLSDSLADGDDGQPVTTESKNGVSPTASPAPKRSAKSRWKVSAKKALLQWAKEQCAGLGNVNVTDFKSSWKNGLAFLAIIHSLRPDLVDMDQLQRRSNEENLQEAFRIAEQELKIPRLLEPEDVNVSSPDEKSIMTYVAQFLQYSKSAAEPTKNIPDDVRKAIEWLNLEEQKLKSLFAAMAVETYTKKYQEILLFMRRFNEQKRVFISDLPLKFLPAAEQELIKRSLANITSQIAEWKLELDRSLPPPLNDTEAWLSEAERLMSQKLPESESHHSAMSLLQNISENFKGLLVNTATHVQNIQSFKNIDDNGVVLVPSDKIEEMKARMDRITAAVHFPMLLDYHRAGHCVLALLEEGKPNLKSWNSKHKTLDRVEALLADWNDFINEKQFMVHLKMAFQKFEELYNQLVDSDEYANDPEISKEYELIKSKYKRFGESVQNARSNLENIRSSWMHYENNVRLITGWLDEQQRTPTMRVPKEILRKWKSVHTSLNNDGKFLIERTNEKTASKLADSLKCVNSRWTKYDKMYEDMKEVENGSNTHEESYHKEDKTKQMISLPVSAVSLRLYIQALQGTEKNAGLAVIAKQILNQVETTENLLGSVESWSSGAEKDLGSIDQQQDTKESFTEKLQALHDQGISCQEHIAEAKRSLQAAKHIILSHRELQHLNTDGIGEKIAHAQETVQNLVSRVAGTLRPPTLHLSESDIKNNFESSKGKLETYITTAMSLLGQRVTPDEFISQYEKTLSTFGSEDLDEFLEAADQMKTISTATEKSAVDQVSADLRNKWKNVHNEMESYVFQLKIHVLKTKFDNLFCKLDKQIIKEKESIGIADSEELIKEHQKTETDSVPQEGGSCSPCETNGLTLELLLERYDAEQCDLELFLQSSRQRLIPDSPLDDGDLQSLQIRLHDLQNVEQLVDATEKNRFSEKRAELKSDVEKMTEEITCRIQSLCTTLNILLPIQQEVILLCESDKPARPQELEQFTVSNIRQAFQELKDVQSVVEDHIQQCDNLELSAETGDQLSPVDLQAVQSIAHQYKTQLEATSESMRERENILKDLDRFLSSLRIAKLAIEREAGVVGMDRTALQDKLKNLEDIEKDIYRLIQEAEQLDGCLHTVDIFLEDPECGGATCCKNLISGFPNKVQSVKQAVLQELQNLEQREVLGMQSPNVALNVLMPIQQEVALLCESNQQPENQEMETFTLSNIDSVFQEIKDVQSSVEDQIQRCDNLQSSVDIGDRLSPEEFQAAQSTMYRFKTQLKATKESMKEREIILKALEQFLSSLGSTKLAIEREASVVGMDRKSLQEKQKNLEELEKEILKLTEEALQLDGHLKTVDILLEDPEFGGETTCQKLISRFPDKLEIVKQAVLQELLNLKQKESLETLTTQHTDLYKIIQDIYDQIETVGLSDPTLHSVQQRMKHLVDLEKKLDFCAHEKMCISERLNELLPAGQGIKFKGDEECESLLEDSRQYIVYSKEQCDKVMGLLRKFQKCKTALGTLIQKGENTVSQRPSFMGKENLQKTMTEVEAVKQEFNEQAENVDKIHSICKELQFHLNKMKCFGNPPFQDEANVIIDKWLDVNEKMDNYSENLKSVICLWNKVLGLSEEIEQWAESKGKFCEDYALTKEDISSLNIELQRQEQKLDEISKRTTEIQNILESDEPPLELQVIKTCLLKKMEPLRVYTTSAPESMISVSEKISDAFPATTTSSQITVSPSDGVFNGTNVVTVDTNEDVASLDQIDVGKQVVMEAEIANQLSDEPKYSSLPPFEHQRISEQAGLHGDAPSEHLEVFRIKLAELMKKRNGLHSELQPGLQEKQDQLKTCTRLVQETRDLTDSLEQLNPVESAPFPSSFSADQWLDFKDVHKNMLIQLQDTMQVLESRVHEHQRYESLTAALNSKMTAFSEELLNFTDSSWQNAARKQKRHKLQELNVRLEGMETDLLQILLLVEHMKQSTSSPGVSDIQKEMEMYHSKMQGFNEQLQSLEQDLTHSLSEEENPNGNDITDGETMHLEMKEPPAEKENHPMKIGGKGRKKKKLISGPKTEEKQEVEEQSLKLDISQGNGSTLDKKEQTVSVMMASNMDLDVDHTQEVLKNLREWLQESRTQLLTLKNTLCDEDKLAEKIRTIQNLHAEIAQKKIDVEALDRKSGKVEEKRLQGTAKEQREQKEAIGQLRKLLLDCDSYQRQMETSLRDLRACGEKFPHISRLLNTVEEKLNKRESLVDETDKDVLFNEVKPLYEEVKVYAGRLDKTYNQSAILNVTCKANKKRKLFKKTFKLVSKQMSTLSRSEDGHPKSKHENGESGFTENSAPREKPDSSQKSPDKLVERPILQISENEIATPLVDHVTEEDESTSKELKPRTVKYHQVLQEIMSRIPDIGHGDITEGRGYPEDKTREWCTHKIKLIGGDEENQRELDKAGVERRIGHLKTQPTELNVMEIDRQVQEMEKLHDDILQVKSKAFVDGESEFQKGTFTGHHQDTELTETSWESLLHELNAIKTQKQKERQVIKRYQDTLCAAKLSLQTLIKEKENLKMGSTESHTVHLDKMANFMHKLMKEKDTLLALKAIQVDISNYSISNMGKEKIDSDVKQLEQCWEQTEITVQRNHDRLVKEAEELAFLKEKADIVRNMMQSQRHLLDQPKPSPKDALKTSLLLTADIQAIKHLLSSLRNATVLHMKRSWDQNENAWLESSLDDLQSQLENLEQCASDWCLTCETSGILLERYPFIKPLYDALLWVKKLHSRPMFEHNIPLLPEDVAQQIIDCKTLQEDILERKSRADSNIEMSKHVLSEMDVPLCEDLIPFFSQLQEFYQNQVILSNERIEQLEFGLKKREALFSEIEKLKQLLQRLETEASPVKRGIFTEAELCQQLNYLKTKITELKEIECLILTLLKNSQNLHGELKTSEELYLNDVLRSLKNRASRIRRLEERKFSYAEKIQSIYNEFQEKISTLNQKASLLQDLEPKLDNEETRNKLKPCQNPISLSQDHLSEICRYKGLFEDSGLCWDSLTVEKLQSKCTGIAELPEGRRQVEVFAPQKIKYQEILEKMKLMTLSVRQKAATGSNLDTTDAQVLCKQIKKIRALSTEAMCLLHEGLTPDVHSDQAEEQKLKALEENLNQLHQALSQLIIDAETENSNKADLQSQLKHSLSSLNKIDAELQQPYVIDLDANKTEEELIRLETFAEISKSELDAIRSIPQPEEQLYEMDVIVKRIQENLALRINTASESYKTLQRFQDVVTKAMEIFVQLEAQLNVQTVPLDPLQDESEQENLLTTKKEDINSTLAEIQYLANNLKLICKPEAKNQLDSILGEITTKESVLTKMYDRRRSAITSCHDKHQSYKETSEKISADLEELESVIRCSISQKPLSYRESLLPWEKSKAFVTKVSAYEEELFKLKHLPRELHMMSSEGDILLFDKRTTLLWDRWLYLLGIAREWELNCEELKQEWKLISEEMEREVILLDHFQEEAPEKFEKKQSEHQLLYTLCELRHFEENLKAQELQLSLLMCRIQHIRSSEETDQIPATLEIRAMKEKCNILQEKAHKNEQGVRAELQERDQLKEEIGSMKKSLGEVSSTLGDLQTTDPAERREQLKKLHSLISSEKEKAKHFMEKVKTQYPELVPVELSSLGEEYQAYLQETDEKVKNEVLQSSPHYIMTKKVEEITSGLKGIEVLLTQKSENITKARELQQQIWEEMDTWRSKLNALDSEVQDIAEEDPMHAQEWMDKLTEPFGQCQQISYLVERRTANLNKAASKLEEFEEILKSTKSWIQNTGTLLSEEMKNCPAKVLSKHTTALEMALDDSEQKQNILDMIHSELDELAMIFETDNTAERLDEIRGQVQELQQRIINILPHIQHLADEVEFIEGEVKTMEKNADKIATILTTNDLVDMSPKEYYVNGQVILENIESMKKTLAEIKAYRPILRLQEAGVQSLCVFGRIRRLLKKFELLEKATKEQNELLEPIINEMTDLEQEQEKMKHFSKDITCEASDVKGRTEALRERLDGLNQKKEAVLLSLRSSVTEQLDRFLLDQYEQDLEDSSTPEPEEASTLIYAQTKRMESYFMPSLAEESEEGSLIEGEAGNALEDVKSETEMILCDCQERVSEVELWLERVNLSLAARKQDPDMQQTVEQQLADCQDTLQEIERKICTLLEGDKYRNQGNAAVLKEAESLSIKLKALKNNLEHVQSMLQAKPSNEQLLQNGVKVSPRPEQPSPFKATEPADRLNVFDSELQDHRGCLRKMHQDETVSSQQTPDSQILLDSHTRPDVEERAPDMTVSQHSTQLSAVQDRSWCKWQYLQKELCYRTRSHSNEPEEDERNLQRALFAWMYSISQWLQNVEEMLDIQVLSKEEATTQLSLCKKLSEDLETLRVAMTSKKDVVLKPFAHDSECTAEAVAYENDLQRYENQLSSLKERGEKLSVPINLNQEIHELEDVLNGTWRFLRTKQEECMHSAVTESLLDALMRRITELLALGKEKVARSKNYRSINKDAMACHLQDYKVPNIILVEESEERVMERINQYQQIKNRIDESDCRLCQLIADGKRLQREVNCPELEAQVTKMEKQWLNLTQKVNHELQRLESLIRHLASYRKDSAELSEWLDCAHQKLSSWKIQSLHASQDLETVRNSLTQFFEFTNDVDQKSSLKTSVLNTGSQLLRLKEADSAVLKVSLAKFEESWAELITTLPVVQEKLQQLLMEKLPSRDAIQGMMDWMEQVRHVREGGENPQATASDIRNQLQQCKDLKKEMSHKQWVVDFVNQSVLQLSVGDVESRRYERTEFAEHLGTMNLQWHQMQGELNRKIQHLEQALEILAEHESRIQTISNWLDAQQLLLSKSQRPSSVTAAESILADCSDLEEQLVNKADSIVELKKEYGDHSVSEDLLTKNLFRKRDTVASQCVQDEVEQQEEKWIKLRHSLDSLRVLCSPSVLAMLEEKYSHLYTRWSAAHQGLTGHMQAVQHLLQLWEAYNGPHMKHTLRLGQLEDKCQQLLSAKISEDKEKDTLKQRMQDLHVLEQGLQELRRNAAQVSELADKVIQQDPNASDILLSERLSSTHRIALLEVNVSSKASELKLIMNEVEAFKTDLKTLQGQVQSSADKVCPSGKEREANPDVIKQHLLELSELSADIERLNENSFILPLDDDSLKKLQHLNRTWTKAAATSLEKCREQCMIQLEKNSFVQNYEIWMQSLEKMEDSLTAGIAGTFEALKKQQQIYERLQAEIAINENILPSFVTKALSLLEAGEEENRAEFILKLTALKEKWQSVIRLVQKRKREINALLKQWRYFNISHQRLGNYISGIQSAVASVRHGKCNGLFHTRKLLHYFKDKERGLKRLQTAYCTTLNHCKEILEVADPKTKEILQHSVAHLQEQWEGTLLQLQDIQNQLNLTVQEWQNFQRKAGDQMKILSDLKLKVEEPLPILHEELQKCKEPTQDLEESLDEWNKSLKDLTNMKTELSPYIIAEDGFVLKKQIEALHRQWEELCLRVSLRKQEIEDRLNAWNVFNEKNKEMCEWLTQMESKVLQTADVNIEEMIEKLQKDCMEEINLFSENKLHLKQIGEQLIVASNKARSTEIDNKLNKINDRWQHLFDVIGSRVKKLKDTLVIIQQLDKNMSNLRTWLARIESELSKPIVYSICDDQEIQKKLSEQQDLQKDIELHSAGVASVLKICEHLLHDTDACANETECDSIQQTTRSLDKRWRNIYTMSMERRLRIEETWRLWQKFLEDYSRFEEWLQEAEATAASPESSEVLYTRAKEEQKKFEAFQRQIHERLTHLELINKQYRRLARENRTDASSRLKQMVHDGNQRWDKLQRRVAAILKRLKHFTSQREEFEGTRESIIVWLTEMDLQLTNVEHFSESNTEDKMRRLNEFQKEITLNTDRIDQLIVFGEQLIQKSEVLDAVDIEEELEELHRYCQEVFGRVSRFHQRLTSRDLQLEEEREASENDTDAEDTREIQNTSWHTTVHEAETSHPSLCLLMPPTLPHERSGRETPVSVDSIPLEWDHTVDVGGSSSHEDEEEGPYFNALSDVEIPESPEAYVIMTTKTVQASSGKSDLETASWHSPEKQRSTRKHHYKQHEIQKGPLTTTTGTNTSSDLATSVEISTLTYSGAEDQEHRTPSTTDENPEDPGLLGIVSPETHTGVIERWEIIQAQSLSDELRAKQNLQQWQQLNSDLNNITLWLEKTESDLESAKKLEPAFTIHDLEHKVKRLKDTVKAFDNYKALVISANLSSKEFQHSDDSESTDVLSRLQNVNVRWDKACHERDRWRKNLQADLVQCKEFHDTSNQLLFWLTEAEEQRLRSRVTDHSADPDLLLQSQKELMQLEEQLLEKQIQVNRLQDISSYLLDNTAETGYTESDEKVHVIGSKLRQLVKEVSQDLLAVQQALDNSASEVDSLGSIPSDTPAGVGTTSKDTDREPKQSGTVQEASKTRSFLYRVLRAAFPFQLLLLLLLLLACMIPFSEEDYSCTQANNFARSFYPMLRYTNGPPPT
ncbi:nesprin-2 [Rhinophrynus dorsalis]